ncbi:hypothetical protein FHS95_002531 [Sphingomonas naasensis]|uniref:carboxypeptidase-like regulatory domain-containing protein n=1 Tax=Sphingomonas naasensis TaxID=1344951 RepID=UPI00141B0A97|nr:carboxypeptidase-like regulatory domain-containing protein [Sphingomonas naasensis]NIJ20839.1 hypothetical protein [Sphingomonas naasensis]
MRGLDALGIVAAAMTVAGCAAEPSQAQAVERWVVKGRVVDEQGRPVPRAKILADNELLYNSYASGTTDANGNYRILLPHVHVTWSMSGQAVRIVGGEKIETNLSPDNDDSFAGNTGAVRNFTLRAAGERPDGGHYGASVVLYSEPGSIFDTVGAQLKFEPLDGRPAFTAVVKNTGDGNAVPDVPVDRYRISASWKGRPLKIRMRNEGSYGPYVEPSFHKVMTGLYDLSLQVQDP